MLRSLMAILTLLTGSLSTAGEPLPPPRQLSNHAWAWIGPYGPPTRDNGGFRMNLGLVIGGEAAAVIDSGYGPLMAEAMLEQIRAITDRPLRYVISTNSQPHRIMGNPVFRRAGATVIAAAGVEERIAAEGPAFATTVAEVLDLSVGSVEAPGIPDRLLTEEAWLDLGGGVGIRLIPVGHAHTAGSLVAQVAGDDVVFAGDVLYGGRLLALLSESDLRGWLAAYERLGALDAALFVPGHGEPGALAEFEHSTRDYLAALKAHMDTAVTDGVDLQDAIASFDQAAWSGLADFDALAGRNAHQAYLQSEQAAFE